MNRGAEDDGRGGQFVMQYIPMRRRTIWGYSSRRLEDERGLGLGMYCVDG